MKNRFGAIEAGGTKFNCMVAHGPDEILAEARFATSTPEETLGMVLDFFKDNGPLDAVGISCFGPLDLNPNSSTYGFITTTPKPGWPNTDIRGIIHRSLRLPVRIDTDVNGAAIAEGLWGASQGVKTHIYFTVGTGIGGGVVVNGQPLHGLVHPELGHIVLDHDRTVDPFAGNCPFHHDCFEGLAAGPAINERWGQRAETLPVNHPAWELESTYIAQALQSVICTLSPERIVLGGGVMQQTQLFPMIRRKTQESLNRYISSPAILDHIDDYIVPPGLGTRSGVFGGLALALHAS